MAFYFARIWLTDSAAKLVLIAAVLVAKISAANNFAKRRHQTHDSQNAGREEQARKIKAQKINRG